MTYIIGDLHFFDKNIIAMAPRNFKSVEEMNTHMIANWNRNATDEDIVIVNGDFIIFDYCTKEDGWDILNQLKGHIILIVGNHDLPYLHFYEEYNSKCKDKGLPAKVDIIRFPIVYDQFWIISHEPMFVSEAAPYANIFAHVHLNPMFVDVSSRSFCSSAERWYYTLIPLDEVKSAILQKAGTK